MVTKLRHGDEVCGKKEDAQGLEWSYWHIPPPVVQEQENYKASLLPTPFVQRLSDPRHVGGAGFLVASRRRKVKGNVTNLAFPRSDHVRYSSFNAEEIVWEPVILAKRGGGWDVTESNAYEPLAVPPIQPAPRPPVWGRGNPYATEAPEIMGTARRPVIHAKKWGSERDRALESGGNKSLLSAAALACKGNVGYAVGLCPCNEELLAHENRPVYFCFWMALNRVGRGPGQGIDCKVRTINSLRHVRSGVPAGGEREPQRLALSFHYAPSLGAMVALPEYSRTAPVRTDAYECRVSVRRLRMLKKSNTRTKTVAEYGLVEVALFSSVNTGIGPHNRASSPPGSVVGCVREAEQPLFLALFGNASLYGIRKGCLSLWVKERHSWDLQLLPSSEQ
ncbi:hypothetical protein EDD16DRAFT_1527656 [Pisolithus croceorrhizus]|nr:hypothetical protein EDD16DRAFT_1527656 [Pisolithus croceorrhizus]